MIPPFFMNKRAGFTLVETLVAIAIMTIAIAGPLYTASRAIIAAEISRDQLIASYLAQEGIEYVRAMRDNEFLATYPANAANAWANFLGRINQCVGRTCILDPLANGGAGTLTTGNAPLYLTNCTNSSGGLLCTPPSIYTTRNLSGSVKTPFVRTIQATTISTMDEKIVSKVSWSFHGTTYSVTSTDHLTPWQ